eukprot:scaffold323504_cov35-Tisochrysis_lutea.AAC.1
MHDERKSTRKSPSPFQSGSVRRTGTGDPLAGDISPSVPSSMKSLILRSGPEDARGESTPECRQLEVEPLIRPEGPRCALCGAWAEGGGGDSSSSLVMGAQGGQLGVKYREEAVRSAFFLLSTLE